MSQERLNKEFSIYLSEMLPNFITLTNEQKVEFADVLLLSTVLMTPRNQSRMGMFYYNNDEVSNMFDGQFKEIITQVILNIFELDTTAGADKGYNRQYKVMQTGRELVHTYMDEFVFNPKAE